MKTKICEMKNTLYKMNGSLDAAEIISTFEKIVIKTVENKREKRIK